MNQHDGNDFDKRNMMIKQASEAMLVFLNLDTSDQDKYGTVIQNLNSQKSLGNDQYPKTIVETNNVLSNHKFDINKEKKQDTHHSKANKNKEQK